ncbi:hypothetical protein [Pseudomonas sp. microsymbiont 2]
MSDHERLSSIQSYVWTLELLGEALVQHDEVKKMGTDLFIKFFSRWAGFKNKSVPTFFHFLFPSTLKVFYWFKL